jgi:hypothetical protein
MKYYKEEKVIVVADEKGKVKLFIPCQKDFLPGCRAEGDLE